MRYMFQQNKLPTVTGLGKLCLCGSNGSSTNSGGILITDEGFVKPGVQL